MFNLKSARELLYYLRRKHPFAPGTDRTNLASQKRLIATEFDSAYYVRQYPELDYTSVDPLMHFMQRGWQENRRPNIDFDTRHYIASYADVRESGINPFYHYLSIGKKEGRQATPDPGSESAWLSHAWDNINHQELSAIRRHFDCDYYLEVYKDIREAQIDPLLHYAAFGWKEGRAPRQDFDPSSYLRLHPELLESKINPFVHFLESEQTSCHTGQNISDSDTGCSAAALSHHESAPAWVIDTIHEYFDAQFYLENYPEARDTGIPPLIHYIQEGWKKCNNPNIDFDVSFYVKTNKDVAEAGIEPFSHYVSTGRHEGRAGKQPTILQTQIPHDSQWVADIIRWHFDQTYYLECNPELANSEIEPLMHYVTTGWREKKNPSPDFDVRFYLDSYDDIAAADIEPFSHFIVNGRNEGRDAMARVSPPSDLYSSEREIIASHFDLKYYVAEYPDVEKIDDPITHFLSAGWRENRNPSAKFSTRFYLEANPDVRDAGINPFVHYILSGQREGRSCLPPGGYRARILRELMSIPQRIEAWKMPDARLNTNQDLDESLISTLRDAPLARAVISFSHDRYTSNTGGIQSCIHEEQSMFEGNGDIYIHISPYQPLPILATEDKSSWIGTVIINGENKGNFKACDITRALASCLGTRKATLVIHALHGHVPELISDLYRECNVDNSYFWLHDFFSLCLGFNLLRNDVTFCNSPDETSNSCQLCVYGHHRRSHGARIQSLFEAIPFTVLSPSSCALAFWRDRSNLPYLSAAVWEHRTLQEDGARSSPPKGSPIKVAFLGYPSSHKGWHAFRGLVEEMESDGRYEFFHLGLNPDSTLTARHIPVQFSSAAPDAMQVAVHDNQIDFVLLLSTWPETFCLTAYEGIAGGAEIITTSASGNVYALASCRPGSIVLESEAQLLPLFEGRAIELQCIANRRTPPPRYRLNKSGMVFGYEKYHGVAKLVLRASVN